VSLITDFGYNNNMMEQQERKNFEEVGEIEEVKDIQELSGSFTKESTVVERKPRDTKKLIVLLGITGALFLGGVSFIALLFLNSSTNNNNLLGNSGKTSLPDIVEPPPQIQNLDTQSQTPTQEPFSSQVQDLQTNLALQNTITNTQPPSLSQEQDLHIQISHPANSKVQWQTSKTTNSEAQSQALTHLSQTQLQGSNKQPNKPDKPKKIVKIREKPQTQSQKQNQDYGLASYLEELERLKIKSEPDLNDLQIELKDSRNVKNESEFSDVDGWIIIR